MGARYVAEPATRLTGWTRKLESQVAHPAVRALRGLRARSREAVRALRGSREAGRTLARRSCQTNPRRTNGGTIAASVFIVSVELDSRF